MPVQRAGRTHLEAPTSLLAGVIRDDNVEPGMWAQPLELLDSTVQRQILVHVEHGKRMVCERHGRNGQKYRSQPTEHSVRTLPSRTASICNLRFAQIIAFKYNCHRTSLRSRRSAPDASVRVLPRIHYGTLAHYSGRRNTVTVVLPPPISGATKL